MWFTFFWTILAFFQNLPSLLLNTYHTQVCFAVFFYARECVYMYVIVLVSFAFAKFVLLTETFSLCVNSTNY